MKHKLSKPPKSAYQSNNSSPLIKKKELAVNHSDIVKSNKTKKKKKNKLKLNMPIISTKSFKETLKHDVNLVVSIPAIIKGKRESTNNSSSSVKFVPMTVGFNADESEDLVNPLTNAENIFKSMIYPTSVKLFFEQHWEKKPLLVKRGFANYYSNLFSCEELDNMLRVERVMFGEHLDVTSYTNGQRETHNPDGRAIPSVVWDFYQSGCSIRLLNPQSFHLNIHHLLSNLQEFFGSFVGANIYLTPPGTQGFAPHYDDIEAFILQVEGTKRWRVYPPHKIQNQLPRVSSRNFGQKGLGKPVLDVLLEAGDMLYFPRGFVHQGNTVDEKHSLHITVSTYQKTCWADLFAKMLMPALEKAAKEDIEFRRGLPLNYLRYMGSSSMTSGDTLSTERTSMEDHARSLLVRLSKHLSLDTGCDAMGLELVKDSLPPSLSEVEAFHSSLDGGERWDADREQVVNVCELEPDTRVRLARLSSIRLISPDNACLGVTLVEEAGGSRPLHRLYHAVDNTRIYHQVEPTYLEIEDECLPAVNHLIRVYPDFVAVEDLPMEELEGKMEVARALYERGLLVTERPLVVAYDNGEQSDCDSCDDANEMDEVALVNASMEEVVSNHDDAEESDAEIDQSEEDEAESE